MQLRAIPERIPQSMSRYSGAATYPAIPKCPRFQAGIFSMTWRLRSETAPSAAQDRPFSGFARCHTSRDQGSINCGVK